jgi:hypothetical protein
MLGCKAVSLSDTQVAEAMTSLVPHSEVQPTGLQPLLSIVLA